MQLGCSRKIQAIEPPKIIAPMHLIQTQDAPKFTGKTNGELLEFTRHLQAIIYKQNINLEAIRKWCETL